MISALCRSYFCCLLVLFVVTASANCSATPEGSCARKILSRAFRNAVIEIRRRLFQFLPFDSAEPSIQRLPCAHQPGHVLTETNCLPVRLSVCTRRPSSVANVGPKVTQNRFHRLAITLAGRKYADATASSAILYVRRREQYPHVA